VLLAACRRFEDRRGSGHDAWATGEMKMSEMLLKETSATVESQRR